MIIENNLLECDIIKKFMNEYKFPKELKINLIITNDMDKEYKKYLKKYNKENDYISVFDYNGITCVPNTIDEETTLLINYDRVKEINDNNYEVICTIFHELIHAKDYYYYFKMNFNGNYDSSTHRDNTYGFVNWSEFNAKRISYYEYCKLVHKDKIKSQEELKNILINELPNKNKTLEDSINNTELDFEDIIYELMFYLGRYSIWEEVFPNEFENGKRYPDILDKFQPIINKLYELLKKDSNSFQNYQEIKKLINNFKGTLVNIQSKKI